MSLLCWRAKPKKKKSSDDRPNANNNHNQELTRESKQQNVAIEELKSKLGNSQNTDDEPSDERTSSTELDHDEMIPESKRRSNDGSNAVRTTKDGLIIPKKLSNPVMENPDTRKLQRELLFNQKIGKNVLDTKSELQKAFTKLHDKKGMEQQVESKRQHELEKAIAERARRNQPSPQEVNDDKGLSREFLEARAKLRTRNESQ